MSEPADDEDEPSDNWTREDEVFDNWNRLRIVTGVLAGVLIIPGSLCVMATLMFGGPYEGAWMWFLGIEAALYAVFALATRKVNALSEE